MPTKVSTTHIVPLYFICIKSNKGAYIVLSWYTWCGFEAVKPIDTIYIYNTNKE